MPLSLACLAEQVRICAYLAWFPRIASAEATALERRRSLASGLLKTEAHLVVEFPSLRMLPKNVHGLCYSDTRVYVEEHSQAKIGAA
jgi:hypothetical protein